MTRLVGLLVVLVSCAVAKAAAPSGPRGLRITAGLAPGDTLAYTVSWTAGARATNYDFVTAVSATNGAWTVLYGTTNAGAPPASGTTTGLSFGLKLTAIPWDSATFTVTVTARNGAGSSTPMTATWSVKRRPGPPGPPKVDSSATVTGSLFIKPATLALSVATYGDPAQVFDSIACRSRIVAIGQRWSRGTTGPGVCIDQSGLLVMAPLRDSVVLVGTRRLVRVDTAGHYGEQGQLTADSVP